MSSSNNRHSHSEDSEDETYEDSHDQLFHDHEDDEGDPDYEDEEEDVDEEDDDQNDDDDDDDEREDEDEFHDASAGPIELEVIVEQSGDQDGEEREVGLLRIAGSTLRLTRGQVISLLSGHGLRYQTLDDDDDDMGIWGTSRRRRPTPDPNRFPKVPSDEGRKLMLDSVFATGNYRLPKRRPLSYRVLDRELGVGDYSIWKANQNLMAQQMIPSTNPEMIIHYPDPVCCGQFSDDGNFFYACVKDFRVRMYDTSNPYNWRYYKTVSHPFGQWTLTDADLSPDNKWLAYTSLQSNVCFAPTDPSDVGDPYTLDMSAGGGGAHRHWRGDFAIFSVRFSGDGRTLVVGTGADSIVVYDIESRRVLHHVVGHENDVNAVCFADRASPHILYSGSDDCTIKVWDTRSMGDGREAGAFVGHVEGLTYIDSKGDGRYILSNGKDQCMKLWDLRMAMSSTQFEELDPTQHTRNRPYDYDYRWQEYDDAEWFPHKNDNSLVTFRGHRVQRTLIRCHFSPPGSTNSQYVYSGSQDGFVYVWNLDATLAAKIDVKSATRGKRVGYRRYRLHQRDTNDWTTLIRDVSWHPTAPFLVASAWNGPSMSDGTASVHSYNESNTDEGEPKMGVSFNDRLVEDPSITSFSLS
ncbi:hypothetical protein VTK73DRAFT_10287 [Phialemonium thermophilum]|uniref:WD repeat protein n=1 Tax=Phialemonium thermophilum TaxID=223376 RepID=A0ABR3XHA5_9PEZI